MLDEAAALASNLALRLLHRNGVEAKILRDFSHESPVFTVHDRAVFSLNGVSDPDSGIDALCDALDAADLLLEHIETNLGINLAPSDFGTVAAGIFNRDDAIIVQLRRDGQSLILALMVDADSVARWQEMADGLPVELAMLQRPVNLDCMAARLSLAEAAGIAPGDLLLLPGKLMASLTVALGPVMQGQFDCGSGNWRAGGFAEAEDNMSNYDGNEQDSGPGGFAVPVSLRLPQQAVDAATLAALAPGAVIPLSPLSHGLVVDLLVGGKIIASGEIVELGENFGVHIAVTHKSAPTADAQGEE
jgi:hypothetical protein